MVYSDLHMHSNCSDGFWTPKELVSNAKLRGLKQIALTDHNVISGLEEAEAEAKRIGIKFINGVEINASCHYEGEFIQNHILAYSFEREKLEKLLPQVFQKYNALFIDLIRNLKNLVESKSFNSSVIKFRKDIDIEKINKYDILKDELSKVYLKELSNEDIDELLQRKIFFPELLVRWMKNHVIADVDSYVIDRPKFWKTLMYENIPEVFGIMESDKYFIETEEVFKEIHKAGGIAVIAHPFIDYVNYNETKKQVYDKMLTKFAKEKLINGLELSFYSKKGLSEEEQEYYNKKAKEFCAKHNLISTYGSDCHGPKKGDEINVNMGKWGSDKEQKLERN